MDSASKFEIDSASKMFSELKVAESTIQEPEKVQEEVLEMPKLELQAQQFELVSTSNQTSENQGSSDLVKDLGSMNHLEIFAQKMFQLVSKSDQASGKEGSTADLVMDLELMHNLEVLIQEAFEQGRARDLANGNQVVVSDLEKEFGSMNMGAKLLEKAIQLAFQEEQEAEIKMWEQKLEEQQKAHSAKMQELEKELAAIQRYEASVKAKTAKKEKELAQLQKLVQKKKSRKARK